MEQNIEVVEAKAEELEFIELYIPIYKYTTGNDWYAWGCYRSKEEAIKSIGSVTGASKIKILHHTEKFVPPIEKT